MLLPCTTSGSVGGSTVTHRAPATDEIVNFGQTEAALTRPTSWSCQLVGSGQHGLAMTGSGHVGRIASERGAGLRLPWRWFRRWH